MAATPALAELTALLPRLHSIVLVGKKAATAKDMMAEWIPGAVVHLIQHPSPSGEIACGLGRVAGRAVVRIRRR